jgi:hypothetical protein
MVRILLRISDMPRFVDGGVEVCRGIGAGLASGRNIV